MENTAPRPSKRHKNREPLTSPNAGGGETSTFSFHPEDEYIQKVFFDAQLSFTQLDVTYALLLPIKYAIHSLDFPLSNQVPREPDSFGLDTGGRMMLIPAENFRPLIEEMSTAYAVAQ